MKLVENFIKFPIDNQEDFRKIDINLSIGGISWGFAQSFL